MFTESKQQAIYVVYLSSIDILLILEGDKQRISSYLNLVFAQ